MDEMSGYGERFFHITNSNEVNGEHGNEEEEEEYKEARKEVYSLMTPGCMGYGLMKTGNSDRNRKFVPPRVMEPDECFGPCPKVISREEWGANLPKKPPEQMMFRVRPSVFKQSDSYSCDDEFSCTKNVQLLQVYQMEYLGFTDIAYSFMIGEDGNIYEGRGWGVECEKARGFMGIGFLGYYTDEGRTRPTDAMLKLAYDLILCGVRKGFIASPFGAWEEGTPPVEMMRELIENEEDVDYKTKIEDPGIY